MKQTLISCLLIAVHVFSGCVSRAPPAADALETTSIACTDFLQAIGKKPLHLEFIGCKEGNYSQLSALVASYEVKGQHVRYVESALDKSFGMTPLVFACCGWEALSVSHIEGGVDHYEVSMFSGETLEKDIERVSNFTVLVYKLLELP